MIWVAIVDIGGTRLDVNFGTARIAKIAVVEFKPTEACRNNESDIMTKMKLKKTVNSKILPGPAKNVIKCTILEHDSDYMFYLHRSINRSQKFKQHN